MNERVNERENRYNMQCTVYRKTIRVRTDSARSVRARGGSEARREGGDGGQ